MIRAEVPVAYRDRSPCRLAVVAENSQPLEMRLERHFGAVNPARFHVSRLAVPWYPRQRHQPIAVGDAQQGGLDLRTIQLQEKIVAESFDARDL